ncbi:MAG: AAA family ATPase [Candidatus Tectimicrobiota bacterium]
MMADETLPFELIAHLDPATHRPEAHRQRLARRQLPRFLSDHHYAARYYRPSDDLLLAINMALHTGSPLLLTGEPGTGKTQAAAFVGAYFGIEVYTFVVKSTSTAQDLLYEFDAVGYLHWAQAAGSRAAVSQDPAPEASQDETQAVRRGFLHKRALWQAYDDPHDSVLLIDEIDKAPRDFPNDLLHELDQHSFPHPFAPHELIRPQCGRPPLVIVTSNEERRLPEAFLRRCMFHRIDLTPELVAAAVESLAREGAAPGAGGGGFFPHLAPAVRQAAQQRFWELRRLPGLDKKPSTAELLTWLCILSARGITAADLTSCRLKELPGLAALIKDHADRERL